VARWISTVTEDLSTQFPLTAAPTLLIWGDHDPISPVAVGERLRTLLPHAFLQVISGADQDRAQHHVDRVATLIERHCREADPVA